MPRKITVKLLDEQMAEAIASAEKLVAYCENKLDEDDPQFFECMRNTGAFVYDFARALLQLADERRIPLTIENDCYWVGIGCANYVQTLLNNKTIGRIVMSVDDKWIAYIGSDMPDDCTIPLGRYDTPEQAAEAIWTAWEAEHESDS